jgi:hypothetical protein
MLQGARNSGHRAEAHDILAYSRGPEGPLFHNDTGTRNFRKV